MEGGAPRDLRLGGIFNGEYYPKGKRSPASTVTSVAQNLKKTSRNKQDYNEHQQIKN